MQCEEIEALIQGGLKCATVAVRSDDNTHFEALVVSDQFAGQGRIRRHQMVYATLGALMGREIHAMSILAMTPEEWADRESGSR
jgi:acid stress-induced BolA-like protein IbaG/YrbA